MKKQSKKAVLGVKTRQHPSRGKQLHVFSALGEKEMDTDELVHEDWDEEQAENEEFDADEVVHKRDHRGNIPQVKEKDIDDLLHENAWEDDEPIF